jgi:acyl dehydratase
VAINREYLNRTFSPADPYEVSRVKIKDFADAIGDPNPVYRDRAAAQAAGLPDVIAPPTFAIVITAASTAQAVSDPGLGLNYAMVVHGEQRFEYTRQIVAGDVLTAQATITGIKSAGRNTMLSTQTQIRDAAGGHVCTAHSVIVERGGS